MNVLQLLFYKDFSSIFLQLGLVIGVVTVVSIVAAVVGEGWVIYIGGVRIRMRWLLV